jgi:hypothetical protein
MVCKISSRGLNIPASDKLLFGHIFEQMVKKYFQTNG